MKFKESETVFLMNLLSVEKLAGWLTFLVKKNAKTGEETSKLHHTHQHSHRAYHIVDTNIHVDNPKFNSL
jgi:hypothetical protein